MEVEKMLEYIGAAATLAAAVYAWKRLRATPSLRAPLLAAILCLTAYVNLKLFLSPQGLLTTYGLFDIWTRHIFFYAGQLLFFVFVNRVIFYGFGDRKTPRRNERAAVLAFILLTAIQLAAPHAAHAHHAVTLLAGEMTPYHILLYVTDQGVQHIIAIVFFLISIAVLRSQSLYAQLLPEASSRAKLIMPFLVGNAGLISLHVWEFMLESRHMFMFIPDVAGEAIEYAFVFFALGMFCLGVRRLHENRL